MVVAPGRADSSSGTCANVALEPLGSCGSWQSCNTRSSLIVVGSKREGSAIPKATDWAELEIRLADSDFEPARNSSHGTPEIRASYHLGGLSRRRTWPSSPAAAAGYALVTRASWPGTTRSREPAKRLIRR